MSSAVAGRERQRLCERSLTLVKADASVQTTLDTVQPCSCSRLCGPNCYPRKGVVKWPGSSIQSLKRWKHAVELHRTIFISADEGFGSKDLHPRYLIFVYFFLRHSVGVPHWSEKSALRCYLAENVGSKIIHLDPLVMATAIHAARHMRAFEAVVHICNVARYQQSCFEAWEACEIAISKQCKLPCEAVENRTSRVASAYWLIAAITNVGPSST